LADLHAGDVLADGPELAADFGGGFRLQVPHVLVAGAAGQVDVDERLLGRLLAVLGFKLEEIGQQHAAHAQGADLEEVAALDAVAALVAVAGDREHGSRPPSTSISTLSSFDSPPARSG